MPPTNRELPLWARRIRQRMKDLNLTQAQLIPILNVTTQGAVAHYLNGRRQPSHEQLRDLADFLNLPLDELLAEGHTPLDVEELRWAAPSEHRSCLMVFVVPWEEVGLHDDPWTDPKVALRTPRLACPIACSWQTFATRVHGREAEPFFREGEMVFCDPKVDPEHNDFVLFRPTPKVTPLIRRLSVEGGRWLFYPVSERIPAPVVVFADLPKPCQLLNRIALKMEIF